MTIKPKASTPFHPPPILTTYLPENRKTVVFWLHVSLRNLSFSRLWRFESLSCDPCSDVVRYQRFGTPCYIRDSEDEGSLVLRNFGILPNLYTASEPRRPPVASVIFRWLSQPLFSYFSVKWRHQGSPKLCCISDTVPSRRNRIRVSSERLWKREIL